VLPARPIVQTDVTRNVTRGGTFTELLEAPNVTLGS
jgi:hypothetical protein